MIRQPWRKSRAPDIGRPIYTKRCSLCGEPAIGKRTVWIKLLTGWERSRGYVCTVCYAYWVREMKAAMERGEKFT